MSVLTKFEDAIVLVSTSSPKGFGTAFVAARDSFASYLVTCDHVVSRNAGQLWVRAESNYAVEVIKSGLDYGIDLAILRAEGFFDKPALNLHQVLNGDGLSVKTIGFMQHGSGYMCRQVAGVLTSKNRIVQPPHSYDVWEMNVVGKNNLKPGYSGAPVVDEQYGFVIGVIAECNDSGMSGLIIPVDELKKIWPEALPEPFQHRFQPKSLRTELVGIELKNAVNQLARKAEGLLQKDTPSVQYGLALALGALGGWQIIQGNFIEAEKMLEAALSRIAEDEQEFAILRSWLPVAQYGHGNRFGDDICPLIERESLQIERQLAILTAAVNDNAR